MDITVMSVVIIIAASILLCIGLGYFLYRKRKELKELEENEHHFNFDHHAFSLTAQMGEEDDKGRGYLDTPWETARLQKSQWEAGKHAISEKAMASISTDEDEALTKETWAREETVYQEEPSFFILYLSAESARPYAGYELLQAVLSAGLRYNAELNIFQRFERLHGRGEALFSLASATEAGTFDLNKMGEIQCQGLCLFINLKEAKDPVLAFEKMLDAAYQLIDDLGGEVKDIEGRILNHVILTELREQIQSLFVNV